MLPAACALKLATLACTVVAAALNASGFEFASLLAMAAGHTADATDALKERPRDVVRKAADRISKQIEREHRVWLTREFGADPSGRAEMAGLFAAIPDVLVAVLGDLAALAHADLNPQTIADRALAKVGRTDERFGRDTTGARVLRCLIVGAYAAASRDSEFSKALTLAVQQALLERTTQLQAGQERIETALAADGERLHLLGRQHRRASPRNLRELLMTELRATDFVGRDEELRPLKLWLALAREARDIAVHCVTGQAGAGKTRIALELCEWAEGAGWSAGFVRQEELARFREGHHPSEWRWAKPTLVVVDYAAASSEVLRIWLDALARGEAEVREQPLRILLLERHADKDTGWWADLMRGGGVGGRGRDSLIEEQAPLRLGPLRSVEHRRALLNQAMELAAPFVGKVPVPLPAPGVDALFDRNLGSDAIETEPLFLVMAGIVAVDTGAPAALAMGRLELAAEVVESEYRRLEHVADGAGVDRTLLWHLAACVTLQNGCDGEAATALVEDECAALGERAAPRPDRLVALLGDALPTPEADGVDAVRPDLIGEAFVLRALAPKGRSLARQTAIVERAFRRAGLPVVGTVIRVARDYALGEAAHGSVGWLEHLARLTDDPFALMAIAGELPEQTLALRERAAEITGRIVAGLAARAAADAELQPLQAGWANNLGNRLGDLGEREAALAAAREAADLYRALAARRPDAFGPDLATSLINLANRLSDLGELEAALATAREAADLYRALAAQRPDAFRPYLAGSLNNLANRLSALGEREAALTAAREAVEISRVLAAQRPDAFRANLAMSLNTLAIRLSNLGEREAALVAAREAVELYRALAAQRPDAFRPDLALLLNTLANRLSDLGEREAALAAAREAAELYCALAAQRPDAFRANLATSLWVLADCLDAVDRRDEGLAANAAAIAALSELFQRHKRAFAERIAGMAQEYMRRCAALGREPDAALLAPVAQGLAELQADTPEHQPEPLPPLPQ